MYLSFICDMMDATATQWGYWFHNKKGESALPRFANLSLEATEWLRQRTGSPHLECYTYIDPEATDNSFFIVRTTNKVIHVAFAEIKYDSLSYTSLLEGLYKEIYE